MPATPLQPEREENRVVIPILDKDAHVTYYCSCRSDKKQFLKKFYLNFAENDLFTEFAKGTEK